MLAGRRSFPSEGVPEEVTRRRYNIDNHEKISSFVTFTASEADNRELHASVAPDLDLRYLAQEYEDLQESTMHKSNPKALLTDNDEVKLTN